MTKDIIIIQISKLSGIILGAFMLLWAACPTFAQTLPPVNQIIKVSPFLLRLNLLPGTTQNYPITVTNLSDQPLPINASVEGFDADNEDYGISLNTPSDNPLTKWIYLDKTNSIIPSRSSEVFNARVAVPSSIPLGGYYAVIFFTPLSSPLNQTINSRLGVITLANIGVQNSTQATMKVPTFYFNHLIYSGNPVDLTLRVQNSSLDFILVKPTLTIKPLFGSPEQFQLEEKTILPGKIRRWQDKISLKNLTSGIYLTKLTLSDEENHQLSLDNNLYIIPPKGLTLPILGALALIWLVLRRKRLIKALKVLFD